MTHAEFQEWMVFYQMEPWGTEPQDLRTARICQTLANIHRGRNTRAKSIQDFMPRYRGQKPQQQSWQEQARIARMWSA